MLSTLLTILVVLLIIVLVIAAIVLAIVRLANRLNRRLGQLTGSPTRRGSRRAPARRSTRQVAGPAPSPARAQPKPQATPSFRIRSVFEPKPEMKWLGQGAMLRLHELAIPDPLVYVASDKRASGIPLDPSEIIASLPVNPRGLPTPAPDSPAYARLTPEQRWSYLSWLSAGRAQLPADCAYLQLHFQGLERRALLDNADLPQIVHEVCRLRDLAARAMATPQGTAPRLTSFMRQSGALLWALVAARPAAFDERDLRVLASRTSAWSEDALVAVLAWFARRPANMSPQPVPAAPPAATPSQSPLLPAWFARILAQNLPGARRSVVLDRLPERMATLFDTRFAQRHPQGAPLRLAKRERTLNYRPANQTLAPVECRVPDALGIASQFGPVVDLWNSCIDDLKGLSRVAEPGAQLTLAQWIAMPSDLRANTDNPFAPALAALAASHADESGHSIVTLADLASAVRAAATDRATLSAAQGRALAQAIEEAGMAIEPDPRITELPTPRDAAVVLCATPIPIEPTPDATARYLAAACILRLGAAVAMADGDASDRELEPIAHELERAFDLSEHEHRRLDALMALLRARGSSLKSVGKRLLAALVPDIRRAVGRLLVAVASADGAVGDAERATLRTSYRALGLEATDLESALAQLAAPADQSSTTGTAPLLLDRDAIGRIMAETREVAEILAQAMRGEEASQDVDLGADALERNTPEQGASRPDAPIPAAQRLTPAQEPAAAAPPEGLQPRYAAFFASIMARPAWALAEAQTLARGHSLMLAGAIDTINDWAFDRAGGTLLVEENERLVIDPDRRAILARSSASGPN